MPYGQLKIPYDLVVSANGKNWQSMTLGERANAVCKFWRYDQKKMQEMTGLKQNSISRVCTGSRKGQNLDTVAAIAKALDVSMEFLRGTKHAWLDLPDALARESLEVFLDAQQDRLKDGVEQRLRGISLLRSSPKSKHQWEDFVANMDYWSEFDPASSRVGKK